MPAHSGPYCRKDSSQGKRNMLRMFGLFFFRQTMNKFALAAEKQKTPPPEAERLFSFLVARLGLEPRLTVPKTAVLPLDDRAKRSAKVRILSIQQNVKQANRMKSHGPEWREYL